MAVIQRPLVKTALMALTVSFCLPIVAMARMSDPSPIDGRPTSQERQRFAECHPGLSTADLSVFRSEPLVFIRAAGAQICDEAQCLVMIYKTTDENRCGLNLYGGNEVTFADWGMTRGGPEPFVPIFLHNDTTEAIIDVSNDPPILFRYSVKNQ
jgi:hypothetical protein